MADIDKALPNTLMDGMQLPSQGVDQTIQEPQAEPTGDAQVTQMEDGGAEVSFDPAAAKQEGGEDHYANLAEHLDDSILGEIGSELQEQYTDYKSSRQDWEKTYTTGLDLLGFNYKTRTQPFRNASGVTHPVLAESVTQFQSQAYKELLPADGPVRTQIVGVIDRSKEEQSERVRDFMNYQIMNVMKEYEPEFDQMLFYLPLAGSTFKKVYYDAMLGRAVSKFIPADDLIVPYTATSLEDAEAIIHVL